MKRIKGIILTLALLMAGTLGAWAQYSDKISNGDSEMFYAFGGGERTTDVLKNSNSYEVSHSYRCRIGPGGTIALSGKKLKGPDSLNGIIIEVRFTTINGSLVAPVRREVFKNGSGSLKIQVPEGTENVSASIKYLRCEDGYRGRDLTCYVTWYVRAGAPTTPPTRWEPPSYSNCDHPDSHCRFEELWGEVSFRCNDQYDDSYESAEYQTVIKQEDRIQTKEESGAKVWVPDWDTYVNLKEETTVVIRVEEQRIPTVIEMVAGSIWGNIKKMAEGKSIECEMSHCIMGSGEFDLTEEQWRIAKKYRIHPSQFGSIEHQLMDEPHAIPASYVLDPYNSPTFNNIGYTADDDDIVFACEIKNGAGTAYVFRGEMTLRNKNDKTYKLKAGQAGTLTRDGKITVKKFDANKIAKKFGITNAALLGNITSPTLPNHNSTEMTKRYGVERALVKYKVTRGNEEGVLAKLFDAYGHMERRELKMSNQKTVQVTQGTTSYTLDTEQKTAQGVKNAELNFMDFTTPLMKKLDLKKKGTGKVLNRECTIYANSTTEYYVWQGIVLKKVERKGNTITTTEATSVEQLTSVDAALFKVPSGYSIKK